MNKLTVENKEIDIEKQLAEYQELTDRRKLIEERIRRTEAQKGSVKSHIFEKVCGEYRDALDKLADEIEPVEQAVEKIRQAMADEIENLETQINDIQDQLDELTFRFRVGEFDQTARDNQEAPLKNQLKDLRTRNEELDTTMKHLSLVDDDVNTDDNPPDDFIEKPVDDMADIAPGLEEKADSLAEPIESFDIPADNGDDQAGPDAGTDFGTDPFAKLERPDEDVTLIDESHVPDDTQLPGTDQGLVDPSKWVGEFVSEALGDLPGETNAATTNAGSKADSGPATAPDSLASLADSLEDTDTDSADDSVVTAPQPDTVEEQPGFPVLVITKGAGEGKKLPLLPMTMTLGREHDNNIELKDTDVSRYHARISFERGGYVIEDLEGSSGTWVNEQKIDRTSLKPGDMIKAGGTEMTIEME